MNQKTVTAFGVIGFMLVCVCCGIAQEQQPQSIERIIYIPYSQLEKLVHKTKSGIYLPYRDYQKLMEEVEKARKQPPELPSAVLVSNVSYQGKVKGDFLEVQASYTLNVLKAGWHGIALGFDNIAVKKATVDGQAALLHWKENNYELVLTAKQPGQHQLEIVFVVPVNKSHGLSASASFYVPRSPIAKMVAEIPLAEQEIQNEQERLKIEILPSLSSKQSFTDKVARVTALLGNTNNITVKWEAQAERKVEIKKILHAENITRLQIGENFLQLMSKINYDVIQGDVQQLRIKIPMGFRVLAVDSGKGVGIRDWNVEQNGALLVVNLPTKLADQGGNKTDMQLSIKLEKTIAQMIKKFALPAIEVVEVEREKGFYVIGVDDLHTLKIVERKDITQLDINDLPQHVERNNIQFAFKYLKRPFTLKLELEKIEPEYEVFTNVYAYLDETSYKMATHFQYQVKKSRIFGSKIQIPQGFMLLDVRAYDLALKRKYDRHIDQIKEYREAHQEQRHFMLVTFKKGIRSKNLVLRMQLQKKLDPQQKIRQIELPVFRVEGAKRETGNIGIGVHSSYNITTIDNSQKNIFPIDIRKLFQQGEGPKTKKINIGVHYFDHPIAAKFKIEKRDPLVTAEVYDYISVEESVLKHQFHIYYSVKHTGVKEFSFTLPANIAQQVSKSHISAEGIKEIHKEQLDDKRILYTVRTQRAILGAYKIQVIYEKKIAQIKTTLLVPIFELVTQNTKREHGFIVFKKNNDLDLKFLGLKGLEVTDIHDPNFARGKKQGVLAIFKYTDHGYELTMQLKKLQYEPVLNTIINKLQLCTTVNKDFSTRNEAVVLLINNRKQRLEFELLEAGKVTSIARLKRVPSYRDRYRNYKPYELEKYLEPLTWSRNKTTIRVNIATNVQKNAPFVLLIKYDYRLQKQEMGYSGNFELKPLQFPDIPVTNFNWDLALPKDYQYVSFDSNLVRHYPATYGIFSALAPLFHSGNVDTSHIKQDAETGVLPVYDLEGKLFSFSHLQGGGYIQVTYLYDNWLYTLELAIFLLVVLVVVFAPKTQIVSRLSLVLFLLTLSLFLSSLDLGGYQQLYLTLFWGTIIAAGGAIIIRWEQLLSNKLKTATGRKAHQIIRPEKSAKSTTPSENESKSDSNEQSQ